MYDFDAQYNTVSHIRLLLEEYRKSTERSTSYICEERHKAFGKPGSMLLDSIKIGSKRNGNKSDQVCCKRRLRPVCESIRKIN